MSFATQGFFSSGLDRFRGAVRSVPNYKSWFEFADDLNRLGLEMLEGHEIQRSVNQRLTITTLFVRAHKSFQAAIVLAEMGLLGDARAVLRSAVEGAIALNALANDSAFLDKLIEAHHYNQRKVARLLLATPDYRAGYSPTQTAEMEATVKQVDGMEAAAGRKFVDINWADVALKHCKDLYELLYRSLSSDGTHTTITSINRYVVWDTRGQIENLKVGPDISDMVGTLKAASLMFLWAATAFANTFDQSGIKAKLQGEMQRFARLPQDEPRDAAVVPNFAP